MDVLAHSCTRLDLERLHADPTQDRSAIRALGRVAARELLGRE